MLCEYKDIFGKPNEGFHRFRVFGFAAVDVAGVFFIAIPIWYPLRQKLHYGTVVLLVFLTGIVLHRVFCVKTKLDGILRKYVG